MVHEHDFSYKCKVIPPSNKHVFVVRDHFLLWYYNLFPPQYAPQRWPSGKLQALDSLAEDDWFESREGSVFVIEPRRKICFALFLRRLGNSAKLPVLSGDLPY